MFNKFKRSLSGVLSLRDFLRASLATCSKTATCHPLLKVNSVIASVAKQSPVFLVLLLAIFFGYQAKAVAGACEVTDPQALFNALVKVELNGCLSFNVNTVKIGANITIANQQLMDKINNITKKIVITSALNSVGAGIECSETPGLIVFKSAGSIIEKLAFTNCGISIQGENIAFKNNTVNTESDCLLVGKISALIKDNILTSCHYGLLVDNSLIPLTDIKKNQLICLNTIENEHSTNLLADDGSDLYYFLRKKNDKGISECDKFLCGHGIYSDSGCSCISGYIKGAFGSCSDCDSSKNFVKNSENVCVCNALAGYKDDVATGECVSVCGAYSAYNGTECVCDTDYKKNPDGNCIHCPGPQLIDPITGECGICNKPNEIEQPDGSCACLPNYARYSTEDVMEGTAECVVCKPGCLIKNGFCTSPNSSSYSINIRGECAPSGDCGDANAHPDDSGKCKCDAGYKWTTDIAVFSPVCVKSGLSLDCSFPETQENYPLECDCSRAENSTQEYCQPTQAGMGDCKCNFNAATPTTANALIPYLFGLAGLGGLVWYRRRK